nr:hypothetical protein CPGR_04259 [Mycolicibacter nonchromogenicus]
MTHICTKCTGSQEESFFSECKMPVPADMRCASPGWMTPAFPIESRWLSAPDSTQVTISASRCGWVSKPALGSTMSSLLTSSSP